MSILAKDKNVTRAQEEFLREINLSNEKLYEKLTNQSGIHHKFSNMKSNSTFWRDVGPAGVKLEIRENFKPISEYDIDLNKIIIDKEYSNAFILIHEMAHAVTETKSISTSRKYHSVRWRKAFVELIRDYAGDMAGYILSLSFKKNGRTAGRLRKWVNKFQ